MHSNAVDVHRLSLMVLRLMDADLLLPEEGNALLAEIEAFDLARDKANTERATASSEPGLPMLEALVQTDRLDALIGGQAQEIVRRILYEASGPA